MPRVKLAPLGRPAVKPVDATIMAPVTLLMGDVSVEQDGQAAAVNKSAQLDCMVWAATSIACVRMEGRVTESVATAHVSVGGQEWPVNWNVLRDTLAWTVSTSVSV